jgi:hypothetical protein
MSNNNHCYYNKPSDPIKCVGLRCTNIATSTLKIKYINKTGHFCDNCKSELEKSELIVDF